MSANISGYKPDLSGEIYSYHQDLALTSVIARPYNGRTYTVDVVVNFTVSPSGVFAFRNAEIEFPENDEPPLTDAEMETMYRWFLANSDKAEEAADRGDY